MRLQPTPQGQSASSRAIEYIPFHEILSTTSLRVICDGRMEVQLPCPIMGYAKTCIPILEAVLDRIGERRGE